jgi:hypothetical protein
MNLIFSGQHKFDAAAEADRAANLWARSPEQAAQLLEDALDYVYYLSEFRPELPKEAQQEFEVQLDAAMNLANGALEFLQEQTERTAA